MVDIPETRSCYKEDRIKKRWWEIRKGNTKFFVYDNINGYATWHKKCKFTNLWCSMTGLGSISEDLITRAKTSPSLIAFTSLDF